MSKANTTANSVLSLNGVATATINPYRFVNYAKAAQAGNNQGAIGVINGTTGASTGETFSVTVLGTARVEVAEELFVGDKVTSNADGRAKAIAASEPVNGVVLEVTGSAVGDLALIQLLPGI